MSGFRRICGRVRICARNTIGGLRRRRSKMRPRHSDLLPALAFLLPNFIGLVLFTAGPVIFSLGASFTNWDLQHSVPFAFIGVENFRRMFVDVDFWVFAINTLY